jgi:hypothetical protein
VAVNYLFVLNYRSQAELEKGVARARTLLVDQVKLMRTEIEELCAGKAKLMGACDYEIIYNFYAEYV